MEWAKVVAISSISLLAAISPGPDFAMVVRNSLGARWKSGFLTALGVAAALIIHISYCLFGIGLIIQESPFIFNLIKYAGATYLFYLGVCLLKEHLVKKDQLEGQKPQKPKQGPFVSGFLCNLLNPKAMLFILSIFTQFVDVSTTLFEKFLMGSIFAVVTFLWFSFLSFLITHRFFKHHFTRFQEIIMKVMGVVLCGLGIYIALF